ncbi:hypothetical protein FQN53_002055 [Emmonsiellopsis sp. PD_33]|nr:hypothetical protein FQN53_002055 [Emmonsiellopsis sp. PD_33]
MTPPKKITPADLGLDLSHPHPQPQSKPSKSKSKSKSKTPKTQEEPRTSDPFKWLLAALLVSKPIQQSVAVNTYHTLVDTHHIASPDAILDAGWDRLVQILDEGHYTRFDFSTATKLLDVARGVKEFGGGGGGGEGFEGLIRAGKGEVGRRLLAFKGVGPVMVGNFLGGFERWEGEGKGKGEGQEGEEEEVEMEE